MIRDLDHTCIVPGDPALLSRDHEPVWQILRLLVLEDLVDRVCSRAIHLNLVLQPSEHVRQMRIAKLAVSFTPPVLLALIPGAALIPSQTVSSETGSAIGRTETFRCRKMRPKRYHDIEFEAKFLLGITALLL